MSKKHFITSLLTKVQTVNDNNDGAKNLSISVYTPNLPCSIT